MRDTPVEQHITSFGLSGTVDYDYEYRFDDVPPQQIPLVVLPGDSADFDRFQVRHVLSVSVHIQLTVSTVSSIFSSIVWRLWLRISYSGLFLQ